jgi:hypothetical protein
VAVVPAAAAPPPPLTVAHRFRGPARSGNGGWTAGALAAHLASGPSTGPISVRLSQPPPLDTPLDVALDAGTATATHAGSVVATATRAEQDPTPVAEVSAAVARAAEASYAGLVSHPFPTCFSCGTAREPGDGLRIFPGRVDDDVEGRARVAATWTPEASDTPITWAALDCVGGWAGDLTERLMVLGTMTAHVHALPRVGEEHVLVGGARGSSGRRTHTAATLYDATGRALASAEHVWFAVDPEDFS